jgi:hypothetical protein
MPPPVREDLRPIAAASTVASVTFRVDPAAELRPRAALSQRDLAHALLERHGLGSLPIVASEAYLAIDGALVVTAQLDRTPVAANGEAPL